MSGFFPVGGSGSGSAAPIANGSLSSPAASFSSTAIPGSFRAILIIYGGLISSAAAPSDNFNLRFNSDAGASHYGDSVNGFGTAINRLIPAQTGATGNRAGGQILVSNYTFAGGDISLSGLHAARVALGGIPSDFTTNVWSGLWNNGQAITTVGFSLVSGGNFSAGAYVAVYGYN